ncbi:hypothetical protein HKD37_18G050895 [Glycine soja]
MYVDMNEENGEEPGVHQHIDCSYTFDTSQVFATCDGVLHWAHSVAYDISFVAVIMRSDTDTKIRGRTSFVLIGCERSGKYRARKKDLLRAKPVVGGEGWMGKLICGIHNHAFAKSLVGHPYVGRLTKDEKIIIGDMTKSMVKPRNISSNIEEHNANSYTTIQQVYNPRYAYCSSIRGNDIEMQKLMNLLEQDQYSHWHRLKDEDVVCDIFWSYPDTIKLSNACNLVFLVDITYKTNMYRLLLLDIIGVTSIGMTFSATFGYLEGEHFHIDKNVKAKCKTLVGKRNTWDYVMEALGSLFEIACSPWPMFVDYVKQTWLMHLGNTTINRFKVESAHRALKRLLQNSFGDLCSVWEAMNNMITLQHTKIKASFETSTHAVGHVSKVTFYKKLLGMIVVEFERAHYVGTNPSRCGCIMRTTHDLPCACELSRYVIGTIPLDTIHMFWRRLSFTNQGLSEPKVSTTEEMETISKQFEEVDVCGKVTLKSIGEDSWSLVRNHLLKEPSKWSDEYINLLGGIDRFEELKRSLLVDGLSMVYIITMDKWMNITDMGYVIVSRYNGILVSLSLQQSMTFFPHRSQPIRDYFVHRVICIGHIISKRHLSLTASRFVMVNTLSLSYKAATYILY